MLESVRSLMCSLQLIKRGVDEMIEYDRNEKHNGAVSSNCTPEQHNKSNKTTRVIITL